MKTGVPGWRGEYWDCSDCGQRFQFRYELRYHRREVHRVLCSLCPHKKHIGAQCAKCECRAMALLRPAKEGAMPANGYIPEGGVWTAVARAKFYRGEWIGTARQDATNTVAALCAALEDMTIIAESRIPGHDECDEECEDSCQSVKDARNLLEALR